MAASYLDPNPCGYRISHGDLIITITTLQVKKAKVNILPTCSCQSVHGGSNICIHIISTVKMSLICGTMWCGLAAANRPFGLIHSDNKSRKIRTKCRYTSTTSHWAIFCTVHAAVPSKMTSHVYFILYMVLKRHPHHRILCGDELQGDLPADNWSERGNGQSQTNVRC